MKAIKCIIFEFFQESVFNGNNIFISMIVEAK